MIRIFLLIFVVIAMPTIVMGGGLLGQMDAGGGAGLSCTGAVAFIWECTGTDVTVDGCSAGDSSATASGSDEAISAGECVFNDATVDGADHYTFVASGFDLFSDTAGTVFVKFNATAWLEWSTLWEAQFDADNSIRVSLWGTSGSGEVSMRYEGNTATLAMDSGDGETDCSMSTGTDYIVRARWRQGASDPSLDVTCYTVPLSEIGSYTGHTTDLTDWDEVPAGEMVYVGLRAATPTGSNINIDYVHVYTDWRDTDPNG